MLEGCYQNWCFVPGRQLLLTKYGQVYLYDICGMWSNPDRSIDDTLRMARDITSFHTHQVYFLTFLNETHRDSLRFQPSTQSIFGTLNSLCEHSTLLNTPAVLLTLYMTSFGPIVFPTTGEFE